MRAVPHIQCKIVLNIQSQNQALQDSICIFSRKKMKSQLEVKYIIKNKGWQPINCVHLNE